MPSSVTNPRISAGISRAFNSRVSVAAGCKPRTYAGFSLSDRPNSGWRYWWGWQFCCGYIGEGRIAQRASSRRTLSVTPPPLPDPLVELAGR